MFEELVRHLLKSKAKSILIAGLSSPSGKTRLLQALLPGLAASRRTAVIATGDSKLVVPAQTGVVTTAAQLSKKSSFTVLGPCGSRSASGELWLARTQRTEYLRLLGPRDKQELGRTLAFCQQQGFELVLVDGAADRRAASSPSLCEGVVLTVNQLTLTAAREQLRRWQLPQLTEGMSWQVAVTAATLEVLALRFPAGATLIIPDAGHCFLTERELERWQQRGWRLGVERPVRLLALVATGPIPEGDWQELLNRADCPGWSWPGGEIK